MLAAELPASIERLYAHFLHTPASVTRYAAAMRGLPWSVSAHAKDIWTSEPWEVAEKLADCFLAGHLHQHGPAAAQELAPRPERLKLVYHGLDFAHLPPPRLVRPRRDGTNAADPVDHSVDRPQGREEGLRRSSGRAGQAAAGAALALRAYRRRRASDALKAQAAALGIAERCTWHGAQPQQVVFAALARADLFVLASKKAADGDQDGLPNVLMEAAHQGLAIVSTRAAAIGEFIADGENGLLVAPGAPDELAAALARLVGDPDLRRRLASRASEIVRTRFSFDSGVDWIAIGAR